MCQKTPSASAYLFVFNKQNILNSAGGFYETSSCLFFSDIKSSFSFVLVTVTELDVLCQTLDMLLLLLVFFFKHSLADDVSSVKPTVEFIDRAAPLGNTFINVILGSAPAKTGHKPRVRSTVVMIDYPKNMKILFYIRLESSHNVQS